MRRSASLAALLAAPLAILCGAAALAGCEIPGPVDTEAALEVVYDRQGTPAFAGQAQVIRSCGAGGYCHRAERGGDDFTGRFGAPVGLDFDLTLASTGGELAAEEVARLGAHQLNLGRNRVLAWSQVSAGAMPPSGAAGAEYFAQIERLGLRYDRFSDTGEASPLPDLDSAEGREIFRNWLKAGAPVVERTEPFERARPIGFVAPACVRECVAPTFEAIYARVLRSGCSASRCHGSADPAARLDLWVEELEPGDAAGLSRVAAEVWSRLVEDGSLSPLEDCAELGLPMIDTSERDPMRSIFYRKLALGGSDPLQCGSRMPQSGSTLNEQRLCAIRAWIACGACAPGDPSCAPCEDAARSSCGVDAAGECLEMPVCSSHLP